jgi:26S proteasome regulatory subunit, ATPase 3, interacting protein
VFLGDLVHVLWWMLDDVFNNLHGKVGKTQVQKSLANLVASGEITQKIYGKQAVFVVKQDDGERPSQQELDQLDVSIAESKIILSGLKDEAKEINGILSKLKSSMTVEEMRQKIKQLLQEVSRRKVCLFAKGFLWRFILATIE